MLALLLLLLLLLALLLLLLLLIGTLRGGGSGLKHPNAALARPGAPGHRPPVPNVPSDQRTSPCKSDQRNNY